MLEKKKCCSLAHIVCPWLLGRKTGVEETRSLWEEAVAALACLRVKHGRLRAKGRVNQRVGAAENRPPGTGGLKG